MLGPSPGIGLAAVGPGHSLVMALWKAGLEASLLLWFSCCSELRTVGEMGPGLWCCLVGMSFFGLQREVPTLAAHISGQVHVKFL